MNDQETYMGARGVGKGYSSLAYAAGFLLLAAYFLFAHGCHGSGADTELSAWLKSG